jgi:hypothetical protein
MPIRLWLRAFERNWLRPLGRRLRRLVGTSRRQDRLDRLERRVDELERLVRELTGLAYLRLDDEPAAVADRPREAA